MLADSPATNGRLATGTTSTPGLIGGTQHRETMAKCPRCGDDIPDAAPPPAARRKRWLRWLLAVTVAILVGGGVFVLYALLHLYEWAMTPREVTENRGREV